ncbi:hypothetical protein PZ938_03020 [Luteipulveratus sp. YIM 133132]|uniref:hypothetical protein n=1 Tax=Luteipulveratus flavus TaxID=3031728 RepID=UPI0023B0CB87|nr:hypothetical protein [Luteipulveratus sp. YIM 133132]MDE9364564.1 hypothetical protein [Luteipulveratus sp. YIM 133132]
MKATFRPLTWTGPATPADQRRPYGTFKASWQDTLDLLDRELRHLGATEVVIEADFRESDLRLDGMPRSGARQPANPGIRIAFESKHGPLVYATDSCAYWQHNVRSIALGLEALRAVDRYGITRRAEQYAGWRQIEAATAAAMMDAADARRVLLGAIGDTHQGLDSDDLLVRRARRRAHPDVESGSREQWDLVEQAARVLGIAP